MKELLNALLNARHAMPDPKKNAKNPHFKNKFADLGEVMECLEGPLHEHGLVVTQTLGLREGGITVLVTTVWHADSGQSLASEMPLNPVKNDPQGMGSAITYARRYALKALFGMVDVDDDGQAGTHPRPVQQPRDTVPADIVYETFNEAMQAIDKSTTPSDLQRVGVLIGASGFVGEEQKGLKGAYAAKMKWLQAQSKAKGGEA